MLTGIGSLFPTGGPVPVEFMVGRSREIDDVRHHIEEGVHLLVTGDRRTGKTSVCRAACLAAARSGARVLSIEVPERVDSRDLLQQIVDRCAGQSLRDEGRRAARVLRPLFARILEQQDVPLDLSEFAREPAATTMRSVMSLPLALAAETGGRVVLFLDELQRVSEYSDGVALLTDLLDLYGGQANVVVVADGSDERAMSGLLGAPGHLGKLCSTYPLAATISIDAWREPLGERFAMAELTPVEGSLETLLDFGAGRPYATMLACRHAAMTARRLTPAGACALGIFEAQVGIDGARAQLDAD